MGSVCALRLFTWTSVDWDGDGERREVTPVCPDHAGSKIRSGSFGNGIIVVCEVGNHLVNHCETEEFEAEKVEARSKLRPRIE
jgi:hypothetical protein